MERPRTVEQAALGRAADALDARVDEVISHWLERVARSIYGVYPELDHRDVGCSTSGPAQVP